VSKSLFLLLLLVTLTTAGVSLQSGTLRFEGGNPAPKSELRAGVVSLRDDAKGIYKKAGEMPRELHELWRDVSAEWTELKADAKAEARTAADNLRSMF